MTATVEDIAGRVRHAIADALEAVAKKHEMKLGFSEADTESIIIDPILKALGYHFWEWQKRATDAVGDMPDYTILPNSPDRWFLEAKRWKLSLTDKEAKQAVGYASSVGARWALLTNGDEWRVYDAHCKGDLGTKCAFTLASLSDPTAAEFFLILSKASMTEGKLASMLRGRAIEAAVRAELSDPTSPTMKYLRKIVAGMPECAGVTMGEIGDVVAMLTVVPPPPLPPPSLTTGHTLADLVALNPTPTYRLPVSLILPDGTAVSTSKSWRILAIALVSWCAGTHATPPMPFLGGKQGHATNSFIATEPVHGSGTHFVAVSQPITWGTATVYIELFQDAQGFCRRLALLMKAVNADPTTIRIVLE